MKDNLAPHHDVQAMNDATYSRRKSVLLLHLAVFMAGFTGLFGKLITLNEVDLTFYRCSFSFLILLVFVGIPRVSWRKLLAILCCGALQGVHWMLFYGSIKASNVSIGVVCYALVGFFTAFIEPLVFHKKISFTELLLSALTLLGLVFIFSFDTRYQVGIVIGVASSLIAAIYITLNKRFSEGVRTRNFLFYQMLGGTLAMLFIRPIYLTLVGIHDPSVVVPSDSDLWWLLALSLFFTVGAYMLQLLSLHKLSAFTVNLTYNLEPVYSIAMAFLFFGEARQLNFSFYVGLFLVFLSVILQTARSLRVKQQS